MCVCLLHQMEESHKYWQNEKYWQIFSYVGIYFEAQNPVCALISISLTHSDWSVASFLTSPEDFYPSTKGA